MAFLTELRTILKTARGWMPYLFQSFSVSYCLILLFCSYPEPVTLLICVSQQSCFCLHKDGGTVEKVIYLFSWGNKHGVKEIESYCPPHPFPSSYLDLSFRVPKKGRRVNSIIHVWRGKWASQVVLLVKKLPPNEGDVRDTGLIPGSGRSPGRGHGNPPQYSCLENPMNCRSLVG